MKAKVDFFLAGFPKSATTSVASFLGTHPGICFSQPKEPDLFLPEPAHEIADVFAHARPGQLLGEGSQRYAIRDRYPDVAEAIYAHNPEAKFVFIARHPLERMLSHFKMIDRDLDLSVSVNDIFQGNSADYFRTYIINTSKYHHQISSFLSLFPRKNFLFLWYEDYVGSPDAFKTSLLSFLGLENLKLATPRENTADASGRRSTPLYRSLNGNALYNSIKQVLPLNIRDRYRHWLKIKPEAEKMYAPTPEFKQRFMDEIADDLTQFLEVVEAPERIRNYYQQTNRYGKSYINA